MLFAVLVLLRAVLRGAMGLLCVALLIPVVVIIMTLPDALVLPGVAPVLLLSRVIDLDGFLAVAAWTPVQMYW